MEPSQRICRARVPPGRAVRRAASACGAASGGLVSPEPSRKDAAGQREPLTPSLLTLGPVLFFICDFGNAPSPLASSPAPSANSLEDSSPVLLGTMSQGPQPPM